MLFFTSNSTRNDQSHKTFCCNFFEVRWYIDWNISFLTHAKSLRLVSSQSETGGSYHVKPVQPTTQSAASSPPVCPSTPSHDGACHTRPFILFFSARAVYSRAQRSPAGAGCSAEYNVDAYPSVYYGMPSRCRQKSVCPSLTQLLG